MSEILPHPYVSSDPEHDRPGTWCLVCNTTKTEVSGMHPHQIPVSENTWTPEGATVAFRVWRNRLYRRELGPMFFGGYQIKYVSLANVRLVAEWLGVS